MKGWKIFVLALLIYGVSVFGGFIQDDQKVIVSDPQMGSVKALFASFTRPYYYMDGGNAGVYRPMTSFSLYLNALITGKGAWGFRLFNVLFYGAVCWLVFEVLKKICNEKTAFWMALIFTVLPVHTEAVNNIVGRSEMLSLGLLLLAVLVQMRRKWEFSSLLFLLALLSKETAIVGLPVLIYLMILSEEKKDTKMGVISFYVLVTISYLILRTIALGDKGMVNNATIVENPLKFVSMNQRVMNAFALVPFGIGKIVFPLRLSYDYSFNQIKLATSWFNWQVLLGVLMMSASLILVCRRLLRRDASRNDGFIIGMMMFWGPIVVTGNFLFPVGTIFGERLWFWPSLGLIMIFTQLFRSHRVKKGMDFVAILIVVLFAGRTVVRNIDWLSQEKLFIHDAAHIKDSVMTQSNAAAMYLIKKDFVKGKELMEKADKIYPRYPELMNNWGMYYLWLGDTKTAKEKLEACLKEKPGNYLCESNLKLLE